MFMRGSEENMSGKKRRFFVLLSGNTLNVHEAIIDRLTRQTSKLQMVSAVDECDFILVFCPAGTDIKSALQKLQSSSATKPAVLVVLHHTFDPECVVPDSSRVVHRENTITVDCLFHEDMGLLQCYKNNQSLTRITDILQCQRSSFWSGYTFSWWPGSSSAPMPPANMADSPENRSQVDHLGKGKPQEQTMPLEKEVFVLTGKKYYILLIGETLKSHEGFTAELKKEVLGLQEVKTVDECDFILGFCPVVSRAGTDIEKAVKTLNDISATKPAVLVVLHHTFDPEYIVPTSSSAVTRENTITVDCLFHEDKGLLTCKKNCDVITQLKMQINSKDRKIHQNSTSTKQSEIEENKDNPQEQNMPENNVQPGATLQSQSNQKSTEFKEAENVQYEEIKQLEEFQKDKLAKEEKEFIYNEVIIATELKLVLLARTESDKTAAKNIILGKEEAATSTTASTAETENTQFVAGRKVTVVDTPDLFSPGMSLEEFRQTVGPQAFLLIIPVSNSEKTEHKKDETQVACLKMEEIFRERCWKNTMIIFSVTDEHQKKNIEEFIQSGDQELQELVGKCENRYHCLNIKERGDGSQVSELLEKVEKMVEGSGTNIYQMIENREGERHKTVKDVQYKMQETLDKFAQYINDFENDLRELAQGENNEDNRKMIDALKKKYEVKRNVGEEIKKRYDTVVRMEENRQFIRIILPETMQTVWLSLPDEQNRNLDKKNKLAQLEELFSTKVRDSTIK